MKISALALSAALALLMPASPTYAGGPRHCPPGLAKKDPPCIPPGLARRGGGDRERPRDDGHRRGGGENYGAGYEDGYEDGFDDGYDLAVGDVLDRGDYSLIRDPWRYGLPPYGRDAWRYYLVRDMIVRADPDTRQVLAVIGLIDALVN